MDSGADFGTAADHEALALYEYSAGVCEGETSGILPDIFVRKGQDRVAALASVIFSPEDDCEYGERSPYDYCEEEVDQKKIESPTSVVVQSRRRPETPERRYRSTPARSCKHSGAKRPYSDETESESEPEEEEEAESNEKSAAKKARVSSAQSCDVSIDSFSEAEFKPTAEEIEGSKNKRSRKALESWYLRMNELGEYRRKNGHANVPQKFPPNPRLGVWVNKQREELKNYESGRKTSLSERRINCLDTVNFFWGKRKGHFAWDQKFEELKKFKRHFGHCNVWTKFRENRALGRWVSTQRRNYKSFQAGVDTNIDQERIDKLEELGFVWNMADHNPCDPVPDASASDYGSEQENEENREEVAADPQLRVISDPLGLHPLLEIDSSTQSGLENIFHTLVASDTPVEQV